MTSNELRIGNWVMWQRIAIQIKSPILMMRTYNKLAEGRVKPIPITHEILEKAGGKLTEVKGVNIYILPGCDFGVYIDRVGHYKLCKKYTTIDAPRYICDVPFVHTLQNAIYALTNEELTISLT